MLLLFFEKFSFFQEKSDRFHIFALSPHKKWDARNFSQKIIIQKCSAMQLLIETIKEET